MDTFRILIVNDSFVERLVLKIVSHLFLSNENLDLSILSSANSVEALGSAFITNPNLIIIDSTLPKLSGGELAWFLDQYKEKLAEMSSMQTIITHEDDEGSKIFPDFLVFSKGNKDFLQNLIKLIRINIVQRKSLKKKGDFKPMPVSHYEEKSWFGKMTMQLGSKIIFFSNLATYKFKKSKEQKISPIYRNSAWFLRLARIEILFTFFLILTSFQTRDLNEENLDQKNKDLAKLRVLYYPSVIISIIAIGLVCFQIFAFLSGINDLGKNSNYPILSIIFGKNNQETEYLNITIVDLKNAPVEEAFVTVGQTTYVTNNGGQVYVPLIDKNTKNIQVRYKENDYQFFIDIPTEGKNYTFTINSNAENK